MKLQQVKKKGYNQNELNYFKCLFQYYEKDQNNFLKQNNIDEQMKKQNELECSLVLPSIDTLNVIDRQKNCNDEIKKHSDTNSNKPFKIKPAPKHADSS
jgi:hypothetical protein